MSGPDRVQEQHIEQKSELPVRRESPKCRERERETQTGQTARPRARDRAHARRGAACCRMTNKGMNHDPASWTPLTARYRSAVGYRDRHTYTDENQNEDIIIDHPDLRAGGRSHPAARSACLPALHTPRPRPPPPPQSSSRRRREGKLMELSVGVISAKRRPASRMLARDVSR